MEGINSFEKGLHRTNSPQEQPEGSYVDALNWIRNDSGRLVNEELEEFVQNLLNYRLLGYTPVNDLFICFFSINRTNSEIGIFNKNDVIKYTTIFNDSTLNFKLNFQSEIDSVARVNSKGEKIVYFVEENNPIRRFNLDSYIKSKTTYDTLEDFNLQLIYKIPYCKLDIVENGGLSSGVYSVVLRYRDEINNKTTCNIPTNFISISDDVAPTGFGGIYSDSIDGCPPETATSKGINITLKHVDTNYKFIEVIIITYTGIANALTIKSLGIYDNRENEVINFSSLLQLENSVPLEEINEIPILYNSAKSIEQKDNILILSNLTSNRYDLEFQKVANNIQLHWYIQKYNLTSPRAINSQSRELGPSVNTPFSYWDYRKTITFGGSRIVELRPFRRNVVDSTDYWQSNIYQNPTVPKGFTRGEVYSFSITPIYKDGSIGFAYHIPGFTTTIPTRLKAWVSTENYPDYMKEFDINQNNKLTNKIQHHQMPDFDVTGPLGGHNFDNQVGNYYTGSYINVLRVKAQNIDFGTLTPLIQGYIIGYQQRNSDINTRIIDYGYIRPYLKSNLGNSYRNSYFTGNASYYSFIDNSNKATWSATNSSTANSPYAQYYSIDTLFLNKEIKSSYHIQEIGKGYNAIPNYIEGSADPGGSLVTINDTVKSHIPLLISKADNEFENKVDLLLFFEEGNSTFNIKTPIKINNTSYVSEIYNAQPTTYIANQTIAIKQTSRFWHIETVSSTNGVFNNNGVQDYETQQGDLPRTRINDNANIRLTRIVNLFSSQYGSIADAEYIPSVQRFDDQSLNVTGTDSINLEGDTYVCKTFIRQIDLLHSAGKDPVSTQDDNNIKWFDAQMLIGTYVESKNNLALRHKETNGAEYYPKNRKIWGSDPANSGILNLPLNLNSFAYNKQYSVLNNVKVNVAQPLFFNDVNAYPNRSIYSNQSFESELVDQYRIFPALNFHDIPKDRGVITDTFVFNNNFFHHTEYGLWQSYFNPNTIQSTTQGDVVLGNAGIFRIPSKLIVDIKGGYMGTLDKSGTNTPFGRVFLDHHQGKVFLFAGDSPLEISDLGLFPFFREFVNTTDKYAIGYDWANKRLLISKSEKNKNFIFTNDAPVVSIDGSGLYASFNTAYDIGILNSDRHYKIIESLNNNNGRDIFKFELTEKKAIKFLIISNKNNLSNGTYTFGIYTQPTFGSQIYVYPIGQDKEKQVEIVLDPGFYWIFLSSSTNVNLGRGDYDFYLTFNKPVKKSTISYYPKTQTWTSLHDFSPNAYLSLNREIYAWNDENSSFYNLNNLQGIRKNAYITFVENTQPDKFKRFDRIEMNTMLGGNQGLYSPGSVEPDSYIFKDESFSKIHCWTDRQNTTELDFKYSHDYNTNFLYSYDPTIVAANYYKSSFHAELPLDAVINPYANIFDTINNTDITADFRAHMKGKFLYTKLSYNNTSPLVLNYVKTFFKSSVA
jgi:hypothetical protein